VCVWKNRIDCERCRATSSSVGAGKCVVCLCVRYVRCLCVCVCVCVWGGGGELDQQMHMCASLEHRFEAAVWRLGTDKSRWWVCVRLVQSRVQPLARLTHTWEPGGPVELKRDLDLVETECTRLKAACPQPLGHAVEPKNACLYRVY
jgi:hypothetical protein